MRPIIGVTCSFEPALGDPPRPRTYLNIAYSDAIFAAGGTPLLLPVPPAGSASQVMELIDLCDGVLFTGGPDLNPRHYGQAIHPQTEVLHPRRDALEVELFRAVDQRRTPTLSICLGCQVANVGRGGCLIQHIDDVPRKSAIQHHAADQGSTYHTVQVVRDSHLAKIVGATEFEVNSRHHQTIDPAQVGNRLRPVALAPDGVLEAAEDFSDGRFFLAVQWHPEDLIDRPEHLKLFQALVDAATAGRRARATRQLTHA